MDRGAERPYHIVPLRSPRQAGPASQVEELLAIGSLGAPVPAGGRYFYQYRDGRQNQPILFVREGWKERIGP